MGILNRYAVKAGGEERCIELGWVMVLCRYCLVTLSYSVVLCYHSIFSFSDRVHMSWSLSVFVPLVTAFSGNSIESMSDVVVMLGQLIIPLSFCAG